MAARFAANIAEPPADWHMMQPQWLADLSEERRARLADELDRRDPARSAGDDPGAG